MKTNEQDVLKIRIGRERPLEEKISIGNYVGMPAALLLDTLGDHIWHAFGDIPYQVGSSLHTKQWRDVDVRLILSDEAYAAQGLGVPERAHHNEKWIALTLAFSALGKALTGLPIDFQIQQQSWANTRFHGPRSALFSAKMLKGEERAEK